MQFIDNKIINKETPNDLAAKPVLATKAEKPKSKTKGVIV
jgi:hypothetical protein